jgi:hypothetical protein
LCGKKSCGVVVEVERRDEVENVVYHERDGVAVGG